VSEDPIDRIKRLEPASLKVTLGDGTERSVAVPKNRTRWSRTQQTLDSLSWVHIECLDSKGSVLGIVENDDVLDAVVEASGEGDVAMARVLVDVMRSTMKETRMMFEAQMKGMASLVDAMVQSQANLAQSYEQSMSVQRAAMVAEGAAAGGNPEIMTMMQLALGMMNKPAPQQLPLPLKKAGDK
jgi:hypothetical protein